MTSTLPAAAPTAATRRHYRVALPAGMILINANSRIHNKKRAQHTKALRDAATLVCRTDPTLGKALTTFGKKPLLPRAWIFGVLHPARAAACDPANWYGSFKAAVDGIVLAGVLEDDDATRVIGPDMRLGPVVPGGQIVLHIYEAQPADFTFGLDADQ